MNNPNHRKRIAQTIMAAAILAGTVTMSGCAMWNPFGYSKEWPLWKKSLFFAGPGHCPVCYCIGGAIMEVTQSGKNDGTKTGKDTVSSPTDNRVPQTQP